MSKASRDKGARAERELVHYLTSIGWQAQRVPLSGAMNHYPFDVLGTPPDKPQISFEVKCRASEYKSIYNLIPEIPKTRFVVENGSNPIIMQRSMEQVDKEVNVTASPRTLKKILGLKKLLQGADMLVLKLDRQGFMFIRYT